MSDTQNTKHSRINETLSLLKLDKRLPITASDIVETARSPELDLIAFRAYDAWKHQHNEVTEIPGESQFHQHGLNAAGINNEQFESIMLNTIAAAHTMSNMFAHRPAKPEDETDPDTSVSSGLPRKVPSTDRLSLPLKIKVYLTPLLLDRKSPKNQSRILKKLTQHLGITAQLTYQIQMQAQLREKSVSRQAA